MKGVGRVVVGSAVGGLLGAAAFFAVDGLMPRSVSAAEIKFVECWGGTDTVTGGLHYQTWAFDLTNNTASSRDHSANASKPYRITLNSPDQIKLQDLWTGSPGDFRATLDRETLVMNRSYAGQPLSDKTCKVVSTPRVQPAI